MIKKQLVNHSYPQELAFLSYVYPRMQLSHTEKFKQRSLSKGYDGERKLFRLLEKLLPQNYIILTDLLLKHQHTEFQIDLLLIGKDKIYPLEVKNYEGNYVVQQDNWYAASTRNEIRNPIHQLKRSELLLRNVLQQTRFTFSIEPYIIFIHPEFYLYQATLDAPIIFPTQIQRFIRSLKENSFEQTKQQREIASFLVDQSLTQSEHRRLPNYTYAGLKKGIVCVGCSSFVEVLNREKVICEDCGKIESLVSAVERSVVEFMTLFPQEKVTTSTIQHWCHIITSPKTIRRVLKKCFRRVGERNQTHYIARK